MSTIIHNKQTDNKTKDHLKIHFRACAFYLKTGCEESFTSTAVATVYYKVLCKFYNIILLEYILKHFSFHIYLLLGLTTPIRKGLFNAF